MRVLSKEIMNSIIFCLVKTERSYRYIDFMFIQNEEVYENKIEERMFFWDSLYHLNKLLTTQKVHAYKLLSVIEGGIKESMYKINIDILLYILANTYTNTAEFICNCDILRLSELKSYLISTEEKNYNFNSVEIEGNLISAIVMASKIDCEDYTYLKMIEFSDDLYNDENIYINQTQYLYTQEDSCRQEKIDKIELEFKKKFFKNSYSLDELGHKAYLFEIDLLESRLLDKNREEVSDRKKAIDIINATYYSSSVFDGVDILNKFSDYKVSSIKIKNFINAYMYARDLECEKDIEYNELHEFLNNMIIQSAYLQAYNNLDTLFFKELKKMKDENKRLIKINKKLSDTVNDLTPF